MNKTLIPVACLAAAAASFLSGCATNSEPPRMQLLQRYDSRVSNDGIRIAPRMVRSWIETVGAESSSATLMARVQPNQSIGGLALTATGDSLLFSIVETVNSSEGVDEKKQSKDAKRRADEAAKLGNVTLGLADDGRKVQANIRLMKAVQGGGITSITTGSWTDVQPAVGPGGTVTFAANRLRPKGVDLFRISSDRPGGVSVVRQGSEGLSSNPSLARDGTMAYEFRPIYPGIVGDSIPQIWLQGGSAAYPTQLREGSEPSIAPDGTEITYIGTDGQLWTMPVSGQNPVQLTTSKNPANPAAPGQIMTKHNPIWTPDGGSIIFVGADGKDEEGLPNYDIWLIPKTGGIPKQLTSNGSEERNPAVDPEQEWVYFVSDRGFREGIWRIPFPNEQ